MSQITSLHTFFLYSAQVRLPPEPIGPVPEGMRVNFYVTGGEMHGPKVMGTIEPVGADWLLIRRDSVGIVDIRVMLKTHDGCTAGEMSRRS